MIYSKSSERIRIRTINLFYLTTLILLITVNLDFVFAKLTQEDMPIDQTTGKQIDIDVFQNRINICEEMKDNGMLDELLEKDSLPLTFCWRYVLTQDGVDSITRYTIDKTSSDEAGNDDDDKDEDNKNKITKNEALEKLSNDEKLEICQEMEKRDHLKFYGYNTCLAVIFAGGEDELDKVIETYAIDLKYGIIDKLED